MIRKIYWIILTGVLGINGLNAQENNIITIDKDIQLLPLQDSVFIHTTWHETENYGRVPSNGLIVIKNGQALMIDTPMDIDKTKRLTEYLKDSMHVGLNKLIAGHYHADCIGGLAYLQERGIESVANAMTIEKCKELGLPVPSTSFNDSLIFDFNEEKVVCRYFGGGHTIDNITVWFPAQKLLFGGCLVKPYGSKNLGYTGQAVIDEWDTTIKKIIQKYPDIKTVVPGHGKSGGPELLTHTIELVEKEKAKKL